MARIDVGDTAPDFDLEGTVRYLHLALLRLHYRDVDALRSALEGVRSQAPA